MVGTQLWLYKSSSSTSDFLKRLPYEFKDVVKVSLIPPLRICDGEINGGSSENNDSTNKISKAAVASGNRIVNDVVSRKTNDNEVIEISSDDESEISEVEDVTYEWRAKRVEERRKMMANAVEIH